MSWHLEISTSTRHDFLFGLLIVIACFLVWLCGSAFLIKVRKKFSSLRKSVSYEKYQKNWDKSVLFIVIVCAVLGIICFVVGLLNCIGTLAMLIDNTAAMYTIVIGGGLITLAGMIKDGIRQKSYKWFVLCLAVSFLIIFFSMNVIFSKETWNITDTLRDGWILMSENMRNDIQNKYSCCGFTFYQDNPAVPCPASKYKRGCKEEVLKFVKIRAATMHFAILISLWAQKVTVFCLFLYTTQFYEHVRSSKGLSNEEIKSLVKDSNILRSGIDVMTLNDEKVRNEKLRDEKLRNENHDDII